ncbi:MAG: aminopeptidase, partial [Candidatus Eremiobacteraeota bacterium]|nr:aminopeptidase [Candidatus Eremiobacteraeota bacterium]
RMNVAALATLALGPKAPQPTVLVRQLGYDTTLSWKPVPRAVGYEVLWRSTTDSTWTHVQSVGAATSATLPLPKDDVIFGVRAVDAAAHRSVAAYPTPTR